MNRLAIIIRRHATAFHRVGALLVVALVLLLGVLEVCPAAHEWFHADAGHAEHGCAVTLFAHGVTASLAIAVFVFLGWRLVADAIGCAREVFFQPPCYRLLPGRAPPVC